MKHRCHIAGSVRPYFARSTAMSRGASADIKSHSIRGCSAVVTGSLLPASPPQDQSPLETVREAARDGGWMIMESDPIYEVVVPLGPDRSQIVSITFERLAETGQPFLVYSSRCGTATSKIAMALLRRNSRLLQTAFAVERHDGVHMAVLRGFQRAEGVSSADVSSRIATLARLADDVEQKLMGSDEF